MSMTTALIASTIVSAIGTGLSAISSYTQSQYQAAMSRSSAAYAAEMARRNRELAETTAREQEARGKYEAGMVRERKQKMLSRQQALYGKAGVELGGSPLEFITATSAEYEEEARKALYEGGYEAWRHRVAGQTSLLEGRAAAARFGSEADLYAQRGMFSLLTAPFAIGSSILTGYGRYQYAKKYPGAWAMP